MARASARELLEETGYAAKQITINGPLLPNPALNTARCHVAVASDCELAASAFAAAGSKLPIKCKFVERHHAG